jgi:hypothetical protein
MGHWFGHVLGYARLRRFQHRMGSEMAFDTGHFGIAIRVGGQLYDP